MKAKEVKLRDLKKITALEEEVFIENAFRADLIGKLIENNLYFLKLEIGKIRKNLLGFIIVIKDRDDRANIINFLIKSKFQNKGYGSYLLQKTIEKVKRVKEIQKIVLNVQEQNSNAIKLYQKFNFKKNPKIMKNYYQSGENAYLMELNIDSA